MDRDRFALIEEIFSAAAELPAAQRPAFLGRACGDSRELRREVERLLAAEERAGFLDRPLGRPPSGWEAIGRERSADRTPTRWRVFVTSAPAELAAHQAAACEVARDLGFEPVLRDPTASGDATSACARQVAQADLVLALVGWSRGTPPPPELGGDGLRPWPYWELRGAFECGKPLAVLMAGETLRGAGDDAEARSVVADLRGEVARLAAIFEDAEEPLDGFRRLVRRKLLAAEPASPPVTGSSDREESPAVRPRRWPSPELPSEPYPLLLPYSHPDLLAGRERDLEELRRLLGQPVPIVGLQAPSGTGKSSLLVGALVPALRAEGRPVALERHPLEPGIAGRLLGDLLEADEVDDVDARGFVDRLLLARRLANGAPPILVVDQFDDLLRRSPRREGETRRARAEVGMLLAASAQRLPGLDGPPCRWLLACRQELQGELLQWLADVLRDARAEGLAGVETLPHDFSGAARFHDWPLRPLGTPRPGSREGEAEAARVFEAAITKPLELTTPDGRGRYPWRFAEDGAARLARAFAAARAARPGAPLVPELQVVLAHLLDQAGEPGDGETVAVEVPEDPGSLIDKALERHLRRALDAAFPADLDRGGRSARTRALLALRELADAGLPAEASMRALGGEGYEVLEKLATSRTRLVTLEREGGEWVYALAHDRLAEMLSRLFDEGRFAGLDVDAELLGLRRFVTLRSALFAAGDVEQATAVQVASFRVVEENAEALLWGEERRRWWAAARRRWRRERRRQRTRRAVAAAVVAGVALLAWSWADRRAKRRALLERIASAEPEVAFAALADLTSRPDTEAEELLARWRRRGAPFDVFLYGLGGVEAERRPEALLRIAELGLPMREASPDDSWAIAGVVWALDFFAGAAERAWTLRQAALAPLRRNRPPPLLPAPDDPDWVDVPAGTFRMGSGPGGGRDPESTPDERPRHQVTVSAFRMLTHEVTNAEYRRLRPGQQGRTDLPVVNVTWYQAYTYAAWLGGRLPTEAEWEYAARAGCPQDWCRRDGSAVAIGEVAWWAGNSVDRRTGTPSRKPVMRLEPNPWGLFDLSGNVSEWTADWHGPYAGGPQIDPPGPTANASHRRAFRGGNTWAPREWASVSWRGAALDGGRGRAVGFRVVLPRSFAERAP